MPRCSASSRGNNVGRLFLGGSARQRIRRQLGDFDLLRHVTEQVCDHIDRSRGENVKLQIAAIGIKLRGGRPCGARRDAQCQQVRNLRQQVQRILAAIKTALVGDIVDGDHCFVVGEASGCRVALRCAQQRQPGGIWCNTGDRFGGWRCCATRHQYPQLRQSIAGKHIGAAGQGFVLFQRVDPGVHLIQSVEHPVDHVGGDRQPSRAHFAQEVLHAVHQPRQCRGIEQAGGTLDRVNRAEHLVDHRRVAGLALQAQQPGGGGLQQVARFGNETCQQRVHDAPNPVSNCAARVNSAGRTGLSM